MTTIIKGKQSGGGFALVNEHGEELIEEKVTKTRLLFIEGEDRATQEFQQVCYQDLDDFEHALQEIEKNNNKETNKKDVR